MALVLVVVLAISLLTVVGYAGAFAVVAVHTARQRSRPDPLAEELEEFLDEVLGSGVAPSHGSTRPR